MIIRPKSGSKTASGVLIMLALFCLWGCGGGPEVATPTPTIIAPTSTSSPVVTARASVRPALSTTPKKEATIGPRPSPTDSGKTRPIPDSPFLEAAPQKCTPTPPGDTTTNPIDDAPVRSSVGTGHILTGVVRSSKDCTPIEKAKIIFWLAAPNGQYDNDHRATIFTDSAGSYRFESNYPGLTGGQSVPQIHLYITAQDYTSLETEYLLSRDQTIGTFNIVLVPTK